MCFVLSLPKICCMKFKKDITCEDCLLKCEIFNAISKEGSFLSDVNPLHMKFKRHEAICMQGNNVTHAIYLVSGTAKLYIHGLNNRNIILNILKPHSYIGLLSFFESPVYSYSVTALEDSEICMIDMDFIKKLYIENHSFLIHLNKAFGKSVASIMQKIITLNQKNIRGRFADSLIYLSELHNNSSFNMLLTRKELGELSAISEENTVRLLTELKKEGIIDVEGKQISIMDMRLLKKISEVG
jgi:CRP-like cAMP-binding protein